MIEKISHLKNLGIFRDFDGSKLKNFVKRNLIYGWNGSGKSTLSSLFWHIENKQLPERLTESERDNKFDCRIDTEAGEITPSNIGESKLNIRTFNKDFIRENISWEGEAKVILIVGKENIDEKQKLDKLKEEQDKDKENLKNHENQFAEIGKKISSFLSTGGSQIKEIFRVIDPSDPYYKNYDKRDFEFFIDENKESLERNLLAMTDEVGQLTLAAKPTQKNTINLSINTVTEKRFDGEATKLTELLKRSVLSESIQHLVDNPEVEKWVETGLEIHEEHGMDNCKFCNNSIAKERVKELKCHFDQSYKELQEDLKNFKLQLQEVKIPDLPNKSDLYEEFAEEYDSAHLMLEEEIDKINTILKDWKHILDEKIASPHVTSFISVKGIDVKKYNGAIGSIKLIVSKHNNKKENFDREIGQAKKKLELHYVNEQIKMFNYFERLERESSVKIKINDLEEKIAQRKDNINEKEQNLANGALGGKDFNNLLHRFISHKELSLKFESNEKGYKIIRGESDVCKNNLSEGEKTAVAFVYFITKLREKGNKIEDTIVVIDDPVSSFDSNYLHTAYSYIRKHCGEAKQMFILTHNFTFFKLIRDWFQPHKRQSANTYMLEASRSKPRASVLKDASEMLEKYDSEYHLIFSLLWEFKKKNELMGEGHFYAANLARKLLEVFLNFKFPRFRRNLRCLLVEEAVPKANNQRKTGDKGIDGEKIYKFVNNYSHKKSPETYTNSVENMMGESISVVEDIFLLMERLDKRHYEEMVEAINNKKSKSIAP